MDSEAMAKKAAYDSICMIIDLDGFTVNGKFKARELGYAALTAPESGVYRFDPRIDLKNLSGTDKNTADYVTSQIHGMSCSPDPNEPTCKIANLEKMMGLLYEKFKDPIRSVVGYKGGRFEKDLLAKLNVPHCNIEKLGCPKFNDIDRTSFLEHDTNCGYHKYYQGRGIPHCARQETEVFRDWIERKYTANNAVTV